jgi:hypothetical protein
MMVASPARRLIFCRLSWARYYRAKAAADRLVGADTSENGDCASAFRRHLRDEANGLVRLARMELADARRARMGGA